MLIKPKKLEKGCRIAAVSLSWGGPGAFPHRYQVGKKQFEKEFDASVIESKHALRDPKWLSQNPEARAEDLMSAFSDKSIDGIISTIGGDDSIRILPYVDIDVVRENPKVFMGYSDTTISHAVCHKAGLVSFYGPSLMAGFGENTGMYPYMIDSVRKTLFSSLPIGLVSPNDSGWTVEHLDWANPANQMVKRKLNPCTGWTFHQDSGVVEGRLFGGCLEVLDWMRGTPIWPSLDALRGAVLFLETSEEAPPPPILTRFIRSLAAMGILEKLAAILLGRPGGQVDAETFPEYDKALLNTVREEYGLASLPIVTNMDFGHTDPMFVLPIGLPIQVDSSARRISIRESAVLD